MASTQAQESKLSIQPSTVPPGASYLTSRVSVSSFVSWGWYAQPRRFAKEIRHAWAQSHIFAASWTVARQAPLSMRFFRQEYWSGLPFPSSGDLPDPQIWPVSPASPLLQRDSSPAEPWGSPERNLIMHAKQWWAGQTQAGVKVWDSGYRLKPKRFIIIMAWLSLSKLWGVFYRALGWEYQLIDFFISPL